MASYPSLVAADVLPAPQTSPVPGLLEIAWRHRLLVVLGVGVGMGSALLYYLWTTPVYQSTAQVLVVKKRPDAVTGVDTHQVSIEDYMATHQALVQSTLIVQRAVQKRNLGALRCFAGEKEPLAEVILKGLSVPHARVARGESDNILVLAFQGTVAGECGIVLNAIIESYKEFLEETYRNISEETLRLIAQARDLLHQDLRNKEAAYRAFRKSVPVPLGKGKDGTSIRQERLSNIEAKRSALLLRRVELQGQLAALEAGLKEGDSRREALVAQVAAWTTQAEATRGGQPVTLPDKLYPLLIEEQKLRETRGEKHPEMEAIRQRIALTRNFLAGPSAPWRRPETPAGQVRELGSLDPVELYCQYCKQELRHVEIAEQLLAESYKKEQDSARELTAYEIEDEGFRTEIDRQQKLYESVVKQLQHIDLVKDMGGYDARTISPPSVGKKVRPNALLIFSGAGFLGVVAGLGLAFLAEIRHPRRDYPGDPRDCGGEGEHLATPRRCP